MLHNHPVLMMVNHDKGAFISAKTASIAPPTRCKALKSNVKIRSTASSISVQSLSFFSNILTVSEPGSQARKSGNSLEQSR
jgi:hypothetical protein